MTKKIIAITFGIFLAVFLGEIMLRITGFAPFNPKPIIQDFAPKNFAQPDKLLGFAGKAGEYRVAINQSLHSKVTILEDESRKTSRFNHNMELPVIHLYGCSFTFGFNLSDEATMGWKLQEKLKKYEVKNFGFPGYGLNQIYLKLKQNLEQNHIPEMVIINYASFHDSRNIDCRSNRKMYVPYLHQRHLMEKVFLPRFTLEKDSILGLSYKPLTYTEWPLMDRLAIIHFTEKVWNRLELPLQNARRVSFFLLKEMIELSKQYNFKIIISGIHDDLLTRNMLKKVEDNLHTKTVDISVDITDPQYSLYPHDVHPNERANKHYANILYGFLKKESEI